MKSLSIVIAFVFLFSCQSSSQFDWLVGSWQRTNDQAGSQTYEYWEFQKNGNLKGMGCTIVAGDTVFKEDMTLINKDKQWYLEVSGPNENPVVFTLTVKTDTSFVSENPTHDFPQKISYFRDGEMLKAKVSGGDMDELTFDFERIPQ